MFKLTSLRTKVFVVLLSFSIIPLLLLSFVLLSHANRAFSVFTQQSEQSTKQSVVKSLERTSTELLDLTKRYGQDEELVRAFKTNNRAMLAAKVQPVFERLQKEHSVSVFEFGSKKGNVFLRGHNLEKHGDDKSKLPAVQKALKGESVSGFEFGNSGLAVRAFAPIMFNHEVIGTLQMGIDSNFLQQLKETAQGGDIQLYNPSGEVVLSSVQENTGKQLTDTSITDKVLSGKEVSIKKGNFLHTYLPMFDPTKTEVIGMIEIAQDLSVIAEAQQKMITLALMIGGFTLLCAVAAAFLFSRSIAEPIQKAANFMDEFSKGKLNAAVEDNRRKDEIGLLMKAIVAMRSNFQEVVERISVTADIVTKQSYDLEYISSEMNEGSGQIAATMQELSGGAETQAHSSAELAEKMSGFSKNIQHAHQNGEDMAATTKQVLDLTAKGKTFMDTSVRDMHAIQEVVKASVLQVKDLDEQTKQISTMVQVIHDIAEQTNLLALNAAIEAARAGEHGKGFAVVAGEVRKLSEQVTHSISGITQTVSHIQQGSKEVTASLTDSFKKVEAEAEQIQMTGATFEEITKAISALGQQIAAISDYLTQINGESATIQLVVENIASISQESAAGIEETAAAAQQANHSMEKVKGDANKLADVARELNSLLKRFTW
ncbi:methyl-accepting chemotaxis protein [Bacillus badius]|uniref:methyl-accepting chemotaxis protein n=2 Tax=Bacillus badius TaxID=1455 RepID=UPI000695BBDF|nr:methyl-accepting chemotaxis protein [Bacillus badius]MED4716973.1 methyl-accepting chemotaxis protein [Bacillus badius]